MRRRSRLMQFCRGFLAACACTCLVTCSESAADEISVGVARIDLTPPLEMNAPLGGYGERMNRPAEGVHDPIFAKALVLSDGERRFALVTADMLGFPPSLKPAVVKILAEEGWDAEQIMLLASHSHASIEMNAINPQNTFQIPQIGIYDPKLYEFTLNKLAAVIRNASRKLVPVTVGTTAEQIPGWNRNRRSRGTTTDNELTVTRVDTTDGKPLAALVNFTAHPTFLGADVMIFSAGWPGYLQRSLERAIGDGVTVMYYNGAEGDQAPVSRPQSGNSPWERAEKFGVDLALVVQEQWENTETQADIVFEYHRQEIKLPERTWHPDFLETGGAEYGLSEELLKKMLPKMSPAETASISLRLGDLMIVGVPGEMTAALGLHLKEEVKRIAHVNHVTIGGLADAWISYILSTEEYRQGGYEASVSFYGETLGQVIVDGAIAGVEGLAK